MLQRLYVHNFRCLENFEFKPGDHSSMLLIGRNGSGKSTLAQVFRIFQGIGRGVNRVGQLVKPTDFTLGRTDVPMRFELEIMLDDHAFSYILALELPERFVELRVLEEQLMRDGRVIYSRQQTEVTVPHNRTGQPAEARFNIDWHLLALPVVQTPATAHDLQGMRQWFAQMVILAPVPQLMKGETQGTSLEPAEDSSNLTAWLSGLLAQYPAAYAALSGYLQEIMPDMADFRFEPTGKNAKSLLVRFKAATAQYEFAFDALSDGEKCFFLCAVVLAANQCYGPLFAFWDEPDNYLSLSEVSYCVMALRRGFQQNGQILMTSHNEEAVRRFSHENTWVLGRKSHLEPTIIRLLDELPPTQDVIQSLICGELEP